MKAGDIVELTEEGKEHFAHGRSPTQDDLGEVVAVRGDSVKVRLLRLKGAMNYAARFWQPHVKGSGQ